MGSWAIKTPHCLMGKLFSEHTGLYWNTLWGFPERVWRWSSQIVCGGARWHKHRLHHRPLTPLELPSRAHLNAISSWFTCMNASPPLRSRNSHVQTAQVGVHLGKGGRHAACMCLCSFFSHIDAGTWASSAPASVSRLPAHLSVQAEGSFVRVGQKGRGGLTLLGGFGSASCQLPSSPHLPRTEDNATWLVATLSRSDFGSKF